MSESVRWRLYWWLTFLRDKPWVWSRPIDWIRYEFLWKAEWFQDA